MKSSLLLFLLLAFIAFCFPSCSEDDEITLTLEKTSVTFKSGDAQTESIIISTNSAAVEIVIPQADKEWCSAELINDTIKISVSANPSTEESRKTTITIIVNGADPKTIDVTQPPRERSSEKKILSFIIPAGINSVNNDINGIIDDEKQTITIAAKEWIGNLKEVIVKFEASGPLYIGETEQISEVTPNSLLDELTYTIKAEDGSTKTFDVIVRGPMFTGLPVISIDIDGGLEVVEKTTKLPATFYLSDSNNEKFNMNEVDMTIRGRGNTSWYWPKKPYRIDFPEKTSLFGLTKAKKWVLLANYQDPTLLMNDIAFELGRRFGLQFTHSSIHVELFVNGKYRGNYQLTEQKEIGKGRVDIDDKEGFLVEMDTHYDEDYKFRTNHLNLPVMVADPGLNDESEMDYIIKEIQGLEDALYEEDFPNNSYEKYTDVPSLIDYILINEIVRNRELWHPKSVLCYKDIDTKIMWGPLWDFDWAFGFNDTDAYFESNTLVYSPAFNGLSEGGIFFCRFLKVPEFRAQYKARWNEMKPQVSEIVNYIDAMAEKLNKSQTENFEVSSATPSTKNTSYETLIAQMKEWLLARISMLDQEINNF